MEYFEIGNKLISKKKLYREIEKILEKREKGYSQQEVAQQYGLDRSFISKLERLGQLRQGDRVAVVGFPIKNKKEIEEILNTFGVNFKVLFTEEERISFVNDKSGAQLFNEVTEMFYQLRNYHTVILLASDKRIRVLESLLDGQVITIDIGQSPLKQDVYVEPELIKSLLHRIIGGSYEESGKR
ncbi:transcriptional regulator [Irregularibacter muris]|uniref:Transcriptional regulator n=1 Tax=Irregularibacter muris TaxID=1796619 RepID=A0AAE3L010_9FIRM|nr:transcriptional regulator [Irregularibacter muris]MCR1899072.1 transcriptional regulator [Irregularibacter muris]